MHYHRTSDVLDVFKDFFLVLVGGECRHGISCPSEQREPVSLHGAVPHGVDLHRACAPSPSWQHVLLGLDYVGE